MVLEALAAWRRRRVAREAKRKGDPWLCPYCRAFHPEYEVGGTRFAFGYPSVKLGCCGKVAFMYKSPHSGELLRFVRVGDGDTEWLPEEAYFRWVEEQGKARGHREGSPHKRLLEEAPIDKAARRAARQALAEAQGAAGAAGPEAAEAAPQAPAPPAAAPPAPEPGEFVPVAKVGDVREDLGLVVEAKGRRLALFRVGGAVYAIDNTCAHKGGPLGEGTVEGGVVTCPLHGWRYDVRTGVCEHNRDVRVRAFPVRVDGESVLVGL